VCRIRRRRRRRRYRDVVVPGLVTSGFGVRPVGRRLRGAHMGRAVRVSAPTALPPQRSADG